MHIAKMQLSYMCRYDTPNGGVTYELAKDKKGHDDHAYTMAEGGYALARLRRVDLLTDHTKKKRDLNMPHLVFLISTSKKG